MTFELGSFMRTHTPISLYVQVLWKFVQWVDAVSNCAHLNHLRLMTLIPSILLWVLLGEKIILHRPTSYLFQYKPVYLHLIRQNLSLLLKVCQVVMQHFHLLWVCIAYVLHHHHHHRHHHISHAATGLVIVLAEWEREIKKKKKLKLRI